MPLYLTGRLRMKKLAADSNRLTNYVLVQFYVLRKLIEHEWNRKGYDHKHAYICSLSAHTIVYKGQLMPQQVCPANHTSQVTRPLTAL